VTAEIPPLEISWFIGHNKVTTTLTVYAHLINTDDQTGNMAALGTMAAPKPTYGGNVVPLHGYAIATWKNLRHRPSSDERSQGKDFGLAGTTTAARAPDLRPRSLVAAMGQRAALYASEGKASYSPPTTQA
jgi:hypothetical protein